MEEGCELSNEQDRKDKVENVQMKAVQSDYDEVQHRSKLGVVKDELATASEHLKKKWVE